MKKILLLCVTVSLFLLVGNVSASSLSMTSIIQFDDNFKIYLSTSDNINGFEFGSGNAWSSTFTPSTSLAAGVDYYLHVIGENGGGPGGFLGEFSITGGQHTFVNNSDFLVTNTTDWNGNLTGWETPYIALTDKGVNGTGSWRFNSAISESAHWIDANPGTGIYTTYFSTKISANPVPEPATMFLFGIGLLGLAGISRRKK